MTFQEFRSIIESHPDGVLLVEGRRSIPEDFAHAGMTLAAFLAREFPLLRFRSGNAKGADEAFSRGVAMVDAKRLQVVIPYANHRKSVRYDHALYESPDVLNSIQEKSVAYKTTVASTGNSRLVEKRGQKGRLGAKANYLIRDTMKVTGHSAMFPKPICALFYVDLDDPMAGGTGHTIRVCQNEGVSYAFQDSWMGWLDQDELLNR